MYEDVSLGRNLDEVHEFLGKTENSDILNAIESLKK